MNILLFDPMFKIQEVVVFYGRRLEKSFNNLRQQLHYYEAVVVVDDQKS